MEWEVTVSDADAVCIDIINGAMDDNVKAIDGKRYLLRIKILFIFKMFFNLSTDFQPAFFMFINKSYTIE